MSDAPLTTYDEHGQPGIWVSKVQAAAILGCSPRTIDRHLADGTYRAELSGKRRVRLWLPLAEPAVAAYVAASERQMAPAADIGLGEALSSILERLTAIVETLADIERQRAEPPRPPTADSVRPRRRWWHLI